jgi:hypothetical protein
MDILRFMKIKENQRKKASDTIRMMDFAEWCRAKDLIDISENGEIVWKEDEVGQKVKSHTSNKIYGPRDGRDDLSSDFPDHIKCLGNSKSSIWPFKLKGGKGSGKPIAPVGK